MWLRREKGIENKIEGKKNRGPVRLETAMEGDGGAHTHLYRGLLFTTLPNGLY
jgi:hypothetical protein